MNEPTAYILGVEGTRLEVNSARPHAPVVPHRERRPGLTVRARASLASGLESLGRWVAPSPRGTVACDDMR